MDASGGHRTSPSWLPCLAASPALCALDTARSVSPQRPLAIERPAIATTFRKSSTSASTLRLEPVSYPPACPFPPPSRLAPGSLPHLQFNGLGHRKPLSHGCLFRRGFRAAGRRGRGPWTRRDCLTLEPRPPLTRHADAVARADHRRCANESGATGRQVRAGITRLATGQVLAVGDDSPLGGKCKNAGCHGEQPAPRGSTSKAVSLPIEG